MIAKFLISAMLAVGGCATMATDGLAATPFCEEASVVGSVAGRFAENNRRFLQIDLAIAEFGPIRESRFLPADEMHRVERRYCHTAVTTTDGRKRDLWYLIENNWGFAGVGSSVEFCASGLDPWYVYGAHCMSLR